ncbi:hypothetical protein ACLMJV_31395 [Sinorhizobium meliloti]|uniref:hypothetical protein n=1 Tax=Rhizobium meliloti TaxID=382 RepID=UPI00398CA26B
MLAAITGGVLRQSVRKQCQVLGTQLRQAVVFKHLTGDPGYGLHARGSPRVLAQVAAQAHELLQRGVYEPVGLDQVVRGQVRAAFQIRSILIALCRSGGAPQHLEVLVKPFCVLLWRRTAIEKCQRPAVLIVVCQHVVAGHLYARLRMPQVISLRKVALHSKAQLLPLIPTQLTELLDLITAQTPLALRKLFRGWRDICRGLE